MNDPIALFLGWYDEAIAAKVPTPEAMVLATATKGGLPSARVVLYRGMSGGAFRFFTNYESRKGRELDENPHAALVFHWDAMLRQVRVEGDVERLSAEESDAYFHARPVGHRVNAWASEQSRPIRDRSELLARQSELTAKFADGDVPRPPHWGGYRVVPRVVEFWTGHPDRFHDRRLYTRRGNVWVMELLAP